MCIYVFMFFFMFLFEKSDVIAKLLCLIITLYHIFIVVTVTLCPVPMFVSTN